MLYSMFAPAHLRMCEKSVNFAHHMKNTLYTFILALLTMSTITVASQAAEKVYDSNLALASAGSSATATSGNAAAAIDGNTTSRWESEHGVDPQFWTLDLGQERVFSRIQILWEGAYAKTYTLATSLNGEDWADLMTVGPRTLAADARTETLNFDETTARYIRFNGTERATAYGYSFYEFRVLLPGAPVLTTVTLTSASEICSLGKSDALTLTTLDQNGTAMDAGEVVYTVSPADAGEVRDGDYYPAKKGLATITATVGGQSASVEIFAYQGGNNLCIGKSTTASTGDGAKAVDGNTETMWIGSENTAEGEAARTYDAWFTVDLGAQYDLDVIIILFEGACSQEYHVDFSTDAKDWTTGYTYVGKAGIDGRTDRLFAPAMTGAEGVRYIRFFSTKAATQYGVKVREIRAFGVLSASGEAQAKLLPEGAVLSPLAEPVRVLSLNNSLIDYNDQYRLFNDIASAMGKDAVWTKHTNLGQNLDYHYDSDPLSPNALSLIASTAYTHIILQEHSSRPLTDFAAFRASVKRWVNYIRTSAKNPQAVIILPVNWAYNTENEATYRANNETLMANYRAVAQEFGLVLCPMADAYQRAVDADATYKNSLYTDNRHPSLAASYMAACAEYGVIFGVAPTAITQKPAALSEAEASAMRGFAAAANAACVQVVDHIAGAIRYELHQVDSYGQSLGLLTDATYSADGGTMTGSVFTCTTPGEYTITATRGAQTFTTKAYVAQTPEKEEPELEGILLSRAANIYTEDFDGTATAEVLAVNEAALAAADAGKRSVSLAVDLPEGWKIRNGSSTTAIGVYATGADATTYVGGTSLPANAKNGTWNLGKIASTDRAIGGITSSTSGGAQSINILVRLTNAESETLDSLTISYDLEQYRTGKKAYKTTLYTSPSGTNGTWVAADEAFVREFTNTTATATGAADNALPISVKKVEHQVLHLAIEAGQSLYLAWHTAASDGIEAGGAPCIALDNVSITAHYAPVTPTDCHATTIAAPAATKRLINGHLYILRDERMYNARGARVR